MCGGCPYWKYPAMVYFYVKGITNVFTNTNQHYKFAVNNIDGSIFMAMGTSVYKVDLTTGAMSNPIGVQGPSTIKWWFASISSSVLGNYLYVIQNQDTYRVDLDMGAYDILYPSKLATCILEDSTNPNVVLWIVQPTMIRQVDPLSAVDLSTYAITGANYVCVHPIDSNTLYVTGTFGLKSLNKATGAFTTIKTGTAFTVCQVTPDATYIVLSAANTKIVLAYPLSNGGLSNIIGNSIVTGILITDTKVVLGIDSVGVRNATYGSADSRMCSPGQFGQNAGMLGPDSCTLCIAGNLCPGGANVTSCLPGTYSATTGLREQAQCLPCPAGSYCKGGQCPSGTDCSIDPVTGQCTGQGCKGGQCVSGADCSTDPNTGLCSGQGCVHGDSVETCPPGSYSMQTGLAKSTDCPLCIQGFYCPDTLTMLPCPNNTWSVAGSNDLGDCTCAPGYRCVITKVVHAQVVLQMSATTFKSSPLLQSKYIAAIAAAANVDPSLVTIQGVFSVNTPPTGRRLLNHRRGSPWEPKAIEIHTLIHQGHMIELNDLDAHLFDHGLPPHRSVIIAMHDEVVQTYRHTEW